jgi:hypothetical protein
MTAQAEISEAEAVALKGARIAQLHREHRMASMRLGNINHALNKHGHDPALAAEAEGLVAQIALKEAELKGL